MKKHTRSFVSLFVFAVGVSMLTMTSYSEYTAQTNAGGVTVTVVSPAHNSSVPKGAFDVSLKVGGTVAKPATLLFYTLGGVTVDAIPTDSNLKCAKTATPTYTIVQCLNITSDLPSVIKVNTGTTACGGKVNLYAYARFPDIHQWSQPANVPTTVNVSCAPTSSTAATVTVLSPPNRSFIPQGIMEMKFKVTGGTVADPAIFRLTLPPGVSVSSAPAGCVANSPPNQAKDLTCENLIGDREIVVPLETANVLCELNNVAFYAMARLRSATSWKFTSPAAWELRKTCIGVSSQSSSVASSAAPAPAALALEMTTPAETVSFETLANNGNVVRAQWRLTNNTATAMKDATVTLSTEYENTPVGQLPSECKLSSYRQADCKYATLEPGETKTINMDFSTTSFCGALTRFIAYAWAQGVNQVSVIKTMKVECPAHSPADASDVEIKFNAPSSATKGKPYEFTAELTNRGQGNITEATFRVIGGSPQSTAETPLDSRCVKTDLNTFTCKLPLAQGSTQSIPMKFKIDWLPCGEKKLGIQGSIFTGSYGSNHADWIADIDCPNAKVKLPAPPENPEQMELGTSQKVKAYLTNEGKADTGPFIVTFDIGPTKVATTQIPNLTPGNSYEAIGAFVLKDVPEGQTTLKAKIWGIGYNASTGTAAETTLPVTVVSLRPSIAVILNLPDTIPAGQTTFEGTIEVKNTNTNPNSTPAKMGYVAIGNSYQTTIHGAAQQPDARCGGNVGGIYCKLNGETLQPGASIVLPLRFTIRPFTCGGGLQTIFQFIPSAASAVDNTTIVAFDVSQATRKVNYSCPQPGSLAVSLIQPSPVIQGDTLTFDLTVKNQSTDAVANIPFKLTLTAPLKITTAQPTADCKGNTVNNANDLDCLLSAAAGETKTLTFTATLPAKTCSITDLSAPSEAGKKMKLNCQ